MAVTDSQHARTDNWEAMFSMRTVRQLRDAAIEELFGGVFCEVRAEVL
jgi:hypothetical protein